MKIKKLVKITSFFIFSQDTSNQYLSCYMVNHQQYSLMDDLFIY